MPKGRVALRLTEASGVRIHHWVDPFPAHTHAFHGFPPIASILLYIPLTVVISLGVYSTPTVSRVSSARRASWRGDVLLPVIAIDVCAAGFPATHLAPTDPAPPDLPDHP